MFFNKKQKPDLVEMINFCGQNISTGAVGSYIVYLYKHAKLSHLGYTYKNEDGEIRFIIYGYRSNVKAIRYFKDRCPAMVEDEVIKHRYAYRYNITKQANGVHEVEYVPSLNEEDN